jgi:hypothetical protein
MYLRFGDKGEEVREIQIALEVEVDGIFGRMTQAAVKNFQLKNNLHPDGIVTPEVRQLLLGEEYTTDVSERYLALGELSIDRYWLKEDEYVNDRKDKKFIFLHHTGGGHNPYYVVDGWERDKRGRIATEFVIGGADLRGDDRYDGRIIQAFPDGAWAYHLGNVSSYLQSHSIGIEICNWGGLTKSGNTYRNYLGKKVPADQVTTLSKNFRGYKYFHRYTDAQIEATRDLILALGKKYDIDVKRGIKELIEMYSPEFAFEYFVDTVQGKRPGLFTHTNVKQSKHDIYPCPRMIKMIKSL